MVSLAQLLASHRRILLLDAASARMQAGLLQSGEANRWLAAEQEAGQAIFTSCATLLQEAALRLDDIDAFAFCSGPGSMLGIRTAAMTLRTWTVLRERPVYTYQSLALAARAAWHRRPRKLNIIADARRDTWHLQIVETDGRLEPLRRVPTGQLPSGEMMMPAHFRTWTAAPPGVTTCSYDLAEAFQAAHEDALFDDSAAPDAFQHDAPDYKKWSAQPHSAESAPNRR